MAICYSAIPQTRLGNNVPMAIIYNPLPKNNVFLRPRINVEQVSFYEDKLQVTVTKSAQVVDQWLFKTLSHYGFKNLIIGLDIEWLPNLNPGEEDHPVATLQLCVDRHCLIFQLLHRDAMPVTLRDFLKNKNYYFVGVGVEDDAKKLLLHHGLVVSRTIDLNQLAFRKYNNHKFLRMGLKRLAKVILGKDMAKPRDITLSKWDAEVLNFEQIEYGAIDAFVSSQLARALNNVNN
ncbi:hypothetical protein Leryth_013048 [Lithospermum erythrorhizon]|nr:hypothetical protein Leryth_013048 [Lithospermum erythrorhizon]